MTFRDVIENPPVDLAEWNSVLINDYGFHVKFRKRLRQMFRMHKRKLARVVKEHQDHISYPQYYEKLYVDLGMTPEDATARVVLDRQKWSGKRKLLRSALKCLRAEHEIRDLLETDGRYVAEPDEIDIRDDNVLEPDTAVIASIDLSITRSPIG